jgi:hypothetical protein
MVENIMNCNLMASACAQKILARVEKLGFPVFFRIWPQAMVHQYILISSLVQNGLLLHDPTLCLTQKYCLNVEI